MRRVIVVIVGMMCCSPAWAQTLRVASANIWSGIDYLGTFSVGEVEGEVRRSTRYDILLAELRALNADVVALQEVNPAGGLSCRLADALGYDVVAQRINAGLKLGRFGIPWNLNEGIAILARRGLQLEQVDVVDLAHNFGAFGNGVSLHFTENNAALVARIRVDGAVVHVINVHLDASVPGTQQAREQLDALLRAEGVSSAQMSETVRLFEEKAAERGRQLVYLREYIVERLGDAPVIVLGDWNTTSDDTGVARVFADRGHMEATGGLSATWDPVRNENIRLSSGMVGRTERGDALGALAAWHDGTARRIDHIFVGPGAQTADVRSAGLFLDSARQGVHASDHFGVWADVDMTRILARVPHDGDGLPSNVASTWEYFPVPVYDSNFGLAIVAKTLLVNQLGARESFDAMAFFSMKGEKYFKFVTSFPHTDVRQGKVYDMAADLELRYDWNPEYNFYGIGSAAPFERGEKLTREFVDAALTFSRGWTTTFVTDVRLRWMWNRNTDFSDSGALAATPDARGTERVTASSLRVSARYDTRDIFFNPSRGVVASLELEYAVPLAVRDAEFARIGAKLQWYTTLFIPRTVLAARLTAEAVFGAGIPVHYLPSIGGNDTQRGLTSDRFVDKTAAIANIELRFPIVWRFGGVLGLDAGKVWPDPLRMDLGRWSVGRVVGLRFYYDTFVARADVGFGSESTGLYLNFGQIF